MIDGEGVQPVQQKERIESLDVIRGVAVLGILIMNIWSFAWPREVFDYPYILADLKGNTSAAWAVINILFEGTQRTLFSLLFGAGVLLFLERLERKGAGTPVAKIYYRRTILLILFGLINAYVFLWPADILYVYGLCGLCLYPLRHWQTRSLLILGLCLLVIPTGLSVIDYYEALSIQAVGGEAWAAELAEARPTLESKEVSDMIQIMSSGSFAQIFLIQAEASLLLQTVVAALVFFWDALIAMVFGMALYRIGFLSLQLPKRTLSPSLDCGLWHRLARFSLGNRFCDERGF